MKDSLSTLPVAISQSKIFISIISNNHSISHQNFTEERTRKRLERDIIELIKKAKHEASLIQIKGVCNSYKDRNDRLSPVVSVYNKKRIIDL